MAALTRWRVLTMRRRIFIAALSRANRDMLKILLYGSNPLPDQFRQQTLEEQEEAGEQFLEYYLFHYFYEKQARCLASCIHNKESTLEELNRLLHDDSGHFNHSVYTKVVCKLLNKVIEHKIENYGRLLMKTKVLQ